ncbi:hypothetical protein KKF05_03170 [Patescibacteria group bacterium]|nr:hypothetical protein [Patescibacteria group bacterium]MBU1029567.1 hypothetical protein [Patescibacteria group bacterium]
MARLEQTDQPDVRQAMIVLLTVYQRVLSLTWLIKLCKLGDYPRLRELTCREILHRVGSFKKLDLTRFEPGLNQRMMRILDVVITSSPYQRTKDAAKQLKNQIPADDVVDEQA